MILRIYQNDFKDIPKCDKMAKRKLNRMLVFNVLKIFTIFYISADKLLRDFVDERGLAPVQLDRDTSKKFKEAISNAFSAVLNNL